MLEKQFNNSKDSKPAPQALKAIQNIAKKANELNELYRKIPGNSHAAGDWENSIRKRTSHADPHNLQSHISKYNSKEYALWLPELTRARRHKDLGRYYSITKHPTGIGSMLDAAEEYFRKIPWKDYKKSYISQDVVSMSVFFKRHIVDLIERHLVRLSEKANQNIATYNNIHENMSENARLIMATQNIANAARQQADLYRHMPGNTYNHLEWRTEWERTLGPAQQSRVAVAVAVPIGNDPRPPLIGNLRRRRSFP